MASQKTKMRIGAIIGVAVFFCLSVSMLFVAYEGYSGARVLLLPGRGDSRDLYLYWAEHPLLCFLVATAWLVFALLLLAGLATFVIGERNKGRE